MLTYYTIETEGGVLSFPTEKKLKNWQKLNPAVTTESVRHEIDVDTLKTLHKLSRKPPKCPTCGK